MEFWKKIWRVLSDIDTIWSWLQRVAIGKWVLASLGGAGGGLVAILQSLGATFIFFSVLGGLAIGLFVSNEIAARRLRKLASSPSQGTARREEELRYSQHDIRFWFEQFLPLTKVGERIQEESAAVPALSQLARSGAASAGAITYAGGNTVEATSTSTYPVDLMAVSGLDISPATPFLIVARVRRTGGVIRVGLKLNTIISAPVREISTVFGAEVVDVVWYGGGIAPSNRRTVYMNAPTASPFENGSIGERPLETITTVTVLGATGSPQDTLAVEYVTVFELPTPTQ